MWPIRGLSDLLSGNEGTAPLGTAGTPGDGPSLPSSPGMPPPPWAWTGWQRFGKVMLAPHRTQLAGGDRKLELGDIAVSDSVPATTWTAP